MSDTSNTINISNVIVDTAKILDATIKKHDVEEAVKLQHETDRIRLDYEFKQNQAQLEYNKSLESKKHKMELVRIAKDTLVENSRSKSVEERDISSEDIINFADSLFDYINK